MSGLPTYVSNLPHIRKYGLEG